MQELLIDTEELEFLEIELEYFREQLDKFFQTNGEIIPKTKWIDLFKASAAVILAEDKIFEYKNNIK